LLAALGCLLEGGMCRVKSSRDLMERSHPSSRRETHLLEAPAVPQRCAGEEREREREMGRGHAVKGRKKKRKLHEAAASDAGPPAEEAEELPLPEEAGGEDQGKDEEAAAGEEEEEEHAAVEGLPIVPRPVDGKRRPGAIFVLERACLEVGKVGKVR